jgi:Mrp family chromosome partitioning ATPase
LLSAGPLGSTLQQLAGRYDVVVVDTPPTLSVADPLIVAGVVDAVLLVASASNTHRSQVAASL